MPGFHLSLSETLSRGIEEILCETYGIEKIPLCQIETKEGNKMGDYATNAAFVMAKHLKKKPADIAVKICEGIKKKFGYVTSVETAGPGFINITINRARFLEVLKAIHSEKEKYGRNNIYSGKKTLIEFVSANPTGPLNIVSARAAACGDTLANILDASGAYVEREYYVNDAGRQVELFARSVEARLKEAKGEELNIPEGGYPGEYVKELAAEILNEKKTSDEQVSDIEFLKGESIRRMVEKQKNDLVNYGVNFDRFFSEKTLHNEKNFKVVYDKLQKQGLIENKEGAEFFLTGKFGDDKNRVIKRSDGSPTYFFIDILYHENKFSRGFDEVIDIVGPDHHGYITRLKAAVCALGVSPERFSVIIIQQVNLKEGGKKISMGKRLGRFETLRELVNDVGKDSARFFFLMRSFESHLDFDLELARKQSNENPVYYAQYAYARISSIRREFIKTFGGSQKGGTNPELLETEEEKELMKFLDRFPVIIKTCARNLEVHHLPLYAVDLAGRFHRYYTTHRVIQEDKPELSRARYHLVGAVQIILKNIFRLIGVFAPEKM